MYDWFPDQQQPDHRRQNIDSQTAGPISVECRKIQEAIERKIDSASRRHRPRLPHLPHRQARHSDRRHHSSVDHRRPTLRSLSLQRSLSLASRGLDPHQFQRSLSRSQLEVLFNYLQISTFVSLSQTEVLFHDFQVLFLCLVLNSRLFLNDLHFNILCLVLNPRYFLIIYKFQRFCLVLNSRYFFMIFKFSFAVSFSTQDSFWMIYISTFCLTFSTQCTFWLINKFKLSLSTSQLLMIEATFELINLIVKLSVQMLRVNNL